MPKADIDTIQVRLSEWQNRVSKEIKFVDFATPTFRQKYAKADLDEKAQLLIEREQTYERKHRQGSSLDRTNRRKRNHQFNVAHLNSRQSKSITRAAVGVSSDAEWRYGSWSNSKRDPNSKVFCPKMNSIIYETANPVSIPLCDGMIQAEEEAMQEEE